MNKGYNVIFKIAGICILAGIVITIIFASTAGDRIYHDGNWDISYSNDKYEYENIDKTFDNTDDIENIDISIPYGDVKIIEGEKFTLSVKDAIKNSFTKTEVDGNTLKIEQTNPEFSGFFGNSLFFHGINGAKLPKITITIPENFDSDSFRFESGIGTADISDIIADDFKIELGTGDTSFNNIKVSGDSNISSGVGKLQINDLSADSLTLSSGVGEITGNNLSSQKTSISTGTGSIKLTDCDFNDLDLDNGVGEFELNGKITGDTDIDGGVGEIKINIDGNAEDYFFKSDTGVGGIRLNGKKMGEETGNNNAPNKIDISGGVGEIDIYTND